MGAWGYRSFENDSALDWAGDAEESDDFSPVTDVLHRIVSASADDYLEVDDASAAIAAAEVLAALLDRPTPGLPPNLKDWIAARRSDGYLATPDLVDLAERAIDRVLSNSELSELWDESAEPQEWRRSVADLQTRLRPSAVPRHTPGTMPA
jgi:hypothetical protein